MLCNTNIRFANKYCTTSARLQNWNYSTPATYFITICTFKHNNFFGKIIDNKMELSPRGQIAHQCLIDIPKHFSQIKLLEFVVMPNHVHLLLELLAPTFNQLETHPKYCRDVACNVSTHIKIIPANRRQYFSKISPKQSSISTIIRSYKSAVTKLINPRTVFFAWQPRFYDEIITETNRLKIIRYYIKNNPNNWHKDKMYQQ